MTGLAVPPESSKATKFLSKIITENAYLKCRLFFAQMGFPDGLPGRGHDFLLPAAHIFPVARSNMVGLRRLLDAIADTLGTPPLH